MEHRASLHDRFVERFHFGDHSTPLAQTEIESIEAALETKLPVAFREFAICYGTAYTPTILEELTERGIDHPDVQDFLSANDAIECTTGYWAAGMPDYVIGIASDCMGNMIGFRRASKREDDAPVLFFDHDFVAVSELAPSFDDLLEWYLANLAGS